MSAAVSKWTPGPWVVSQWTPTRVDTADGGISVAWNGGAERIARAEANARLIAEAAALRAENARLREALDALVMACELPGDHCEVEQALPSARAALEPKP